MRLLIHTCCGPCLAYPADIINEEIRNGDIESACCLFHNPNIHPEEENARRRENAIKMAGLKGLPIEVRDACDVDAWRDFSGPEEERCTMCYSTRMEEAAKYAAANGFDAFTTTLLVSPYQKHELIKSISKAMASKYGVTFYYRDFREGFRKGQAMAREAGLYMQKYCGCIRSLR